MWLRWSTGFSPQHCSKVGEWELKLWRVEGTKPGVFTQTPAGALVQPRTGQCKDRAHRSLSVEGKPAPEASELKTKCSGGRAGREPLSLPQTLHAPGSTLSARHTRQGGLPPFLQRGSGSLAGATRQAGSRKPKKTWEERRQFENQRKK